MPLGPRLTLLVVMAVCLCAPLAAQQTPPAGDASPLAANWPMDEIKTSDGTTYQGLVLQETPTVIEFLRVHRPPGKPMGLIVRPFDRTKTTITKRISPSEREALRDRLERFKRRTLIEGRRLEELPLTSEVVNGRKQWDFRGNWTAVESTADEATTRRIVMRLGQIFAAYRQLVPPRVQGGALIQIRVFGSVEQYREELGKLGLSIANPAVYLADKNEILAGSELNRFGAELAQVHQQHQQIRAELAALVSKDVPGRVRELNEELKKNGIPTAERMRIVLAENRKWDDLRKNLDQRIAALDRKNAAKFNEVTARMFRRLAHEAFHAYLEVYVYPRGEFDVPRWLNEGLAQTFEAGLLEADSLRIDAPNVAALTRLQSDLRGDRPLSLRELLSYGSNTFLGVHDKSEELASRAYDYSWGLAYYLAFDGGGLDSPEFQRYLSLEAAKQDPITRFEALVGMPLAEFEAKWRAAMLKQQGME